MLIFKYAKEGTLAIDGLKTIAASCDVSEEGVGGAKSFFEAKINEVRGLVNYCISVFPIPLHAN